ncbi:MAG: hypothetical protein Q8M01_12695 [Rubrivivax sp.]|nr:hypothetical protein [Rubrivivax sp.]
MMGFKRAVAMVLVGMASLGAMAADAASDSLWDQFKAYTHQQKNDAVKAAKKLIADTDKKIDELKRQTRNATAEAKAANEKNMAELQVKKKAAQAELAKLEKAGGEIWDATKTGFSNAARELGQAYDKAVESARK